MKTIKLYAYLMNNLGDDLMVDILLKRFPKCQFYSDIYVSLDNSIVTNKNYMCTEKLYRQYGRLNHLLHLLTFGKSDEWFFSKIFKKYENSCSASVYIGGSLFMEDPSHDVAKQLACEESRITVFPRFVIGANFGPYKTEAFFEGYSNYFQRCMGVTFRDKYSFDLFCEYQQIAYAPDVVLNLDITPYVGRKQTRNVIISVIDFYRRPNISRHAAHYDQYIVKCCGEIIQNGDTPVLMSFCKAEGDEDAINRILELVPHNLRCKVKTLFYTGNIPEALTCIAGAKYIVATRFHSMILAVRFGKPFFCIAYNQKIINVLNDLGYEAWLDPSDLERSSPAEQMEKFSVPISAPTYIKEAERQFAQLEQVIIR